MKPILLKTLAAASLVATTHAEIHVLGASWKERGVNAPLGTIITNPGTVAATRGYLIFDDTILTGTPTPATYIEYGEIRGRGVVERYYTTDTDFRNFLADGIFGDSGGRRLYGHIEAPVRVSTVATPMMPFSGTTFSSGLPRKLSFDQTVFQNGASDSLTGPRILLAAPSTLRSVLSGSANTVKTNAITIAEATDELVARLKKQGYERNLVEAPTIVDNLDPELILQDGKTAILSVGLSPDVFPGPDDDFAGPTYQWFKGTSLTPIGTGATYTVTGGPSTANDGIGDYHVVVSNVIGSVTSATTTVKAEVPTISLDVPATVALTAASSATLEVTLAPAPIVTPTYRWKKSTTGATGTFNDVPDSAGGNQAKLVVIGGELATGLGHYRLDITTTSGTIQSGVSNVTVTTAPGQNFLFTKNSPRSLTLAMSGFAKISPEINPGAVPSPTLATRQWFKAPLSNPTAFVALENSNVIEIEVSGDAANVRGPGVYRMVATNTATPAVTITTIDTVVRTAP